MEELKRKRGRPPKMQQLQFHNMQIKEKQENVKMVTGEYKIKHIIRAISKTNMPMGDAEPLPQVEAYISQYLENGYKLIFVYMLGQDPEMINLLYVLAKE